MNGFLSKVYLNVLVFSLGLALFFTGTVAAVFGGIVESAGFDDLAIYLSHGVLFTLAIMLASGFISTAIVFAKKAGAFEGWASPLNVNALGLLFAATLVLGAGLTSGVQFYLGPGPAALAHIGHVAGAIESAMTLTSILVGLGGGALAVIAAFASRDSEEPEEGAVVDVSPPPQAS